MLALVIHKSHHILYHIRIINTGISLWDHNILNNKLSMNDMYIQKSLIHHTIIRSSVLWNFAENNVSYKTAIIYTVVAIILFPFVLLNCSFPVATPLSVLMVTFDLDVRAVVLWPISLGSSSGRLLVVTPRGLV